MYAFNSVKELIKSLDWSPELLSEMFEKRSVYPFPYEHALEFLPEEKIDALKQRGIIRENGSYLEIDDLYLQFFEQVLEVNQEINTSYIHEHIQVVKQQINYYLQENNESRKSGYLRSIKNSLRKTGRITLRNIIDLNRNIDTAFKTEPNYKIKISKLNHYDQKRYDILKLIEQTENLITEEERTFFLTALDDELEKISLQLRKQLKEARHNLIETQEQLIEYLNQIKYQSQVVEKIRQVKYLKDQFELKGKTNLLEMLSQQNAIFFEPTPTFPLHLSLDHLSTDEARESIKKVNARKKTSTTVKIPVADSISQHYLQAETEEENFINLDEIRNGFLASGKHLFEFMLHYQFSKVVTLEERVTLFCQLVTLFEKDMLIYEQTSQYENVDFAIVYPK